MRKSILPLLFFWSLSILLHAQKYRCEKGSISFYSHATLEDISAENKKIGSIYNAGTGDIVFALNMTDFMFAKALMQEHFNERYMESEKYPKSTFQGSILGYNAATGGIQNVTAKGKLSIHGVTNDIETTGTVEKVGETLLLKSKFIVKLQDYKIAIPQLLWQNIAEQVEVTIDLIYKKQ